MPTAAILAGGRAVRFGGRDKSALVIGGRSILERQIAELLRVTESFLMKNNVREILFRKPAYLAGR